jgi:hypothetical protein
MHVTPFIPTPRIFLAVMREAGMRMAIRACVAVLPLMLLMFLTPSFAHGVLGSLITHVLGLAVLSCIGILLAAIYFVWAPAHDEWLHRRGEPLHLGIRVQRSGMIEPFFSASSRRATPPPRVTHR